MTEEFEKLKEALKKPVTPEAMKEASEALRRYQQVELAKGKGSRPILVSLGYKKPYPSAVPVDKIADELAKNPEFYNLMKRIVAKER